MLVAVLLATQPAARTALADEPLPARFAVTGVAGATLRAEPNGASLALGIVPAGGVVVLAGPDVVTGGVLWRHVRTVEGAIGYLPAGLLTSVAGGEAPGTLANAPIASGPGGAPVQPEATDHPPRPGQAIGAAPAQSVGSQPVPAAPTSPARPGPATVYSAPSGPVPVASAGASAAADGVRDDAAPPGATRQPTPAPEPALSPPRTTVERRRGQTVTVSHIEQEPAPNGRPMGAGRIVVGFKAGTSQEARAAAHHTVGSVATRSAGPADVVVAQVAPGAVQQALAAYRSRPDVAWAEPDYVRRATFTTNDPQAGSQWGLQKIGAPIAWDVTTGAASTRIAILDCGIYSESSTYKAPDGLTGHPDLRGKVVAEANFSDAATGVDDWCEHGTLMAGIAAANTNTAPPTGIAGVGFNVHLLNGKVLNDAGEGYDSWVASGIVWAADNGAQVVSMSLGGDGPCSQTLQAAIDYAWNKGAVIVAAAGNGGGDQVGDPGSEAPGNCAHVIAVGAIDQNDVRASFSNYGSNVPLAAPGVGVVSTNFIGTYASVSGTSPATPHVAAVAGLLWSTAYGSSNQAVVARLLQTADPIVGTGSLWANGRVNAAAAVGPASCVPRPEVTVTSTVSGSALNVSVTTAGLGNVVRFIQTGGGTGTPLNALITFPTAAPEMAGTLTYVPSMVGTTATFQVRRESANAPTTLPFAVTDGCGIWKSFVGGGAGAGF